jgi:metallophosphoesterase superfamily enzyme
LISDLEIELAGERLHLLPERAIFWGAKQTLLIADTHWGKAATMRAAAIPVPGGTTTESLTRLSAVLDRTCASRMVLLGDCIHARQGRSDKTLGEVARWRERHSDLDVLLVRGNHDVRAGDPPADLRFRCVDAPTLCGHLHPAIRLAGKGADRAKLACFWFNRTTGVLPAFGGLTGTAIIRPQPGDLICAIAGDEVVRLQF